MSAGTGSSALLLDTHILVWVAIGSARLKESVRAVLLKDETDLFVSAVTLAELFDLERRRRFVLPTPLDHVLRDFEITVLDFPVDAARVMATLPDIHRDPVDRMLIAHAIHADLTLVTADETMRRYPVRTIW